MQTPTTAHASVEMHQPAGKTVALWPSEGKPHVGGVMTSAHITVPTLVLHCIRGSNPCVQCYALVLGDCKTKTPINIASHSRYKFTYALYVRA